jgi:predicted DNA-binding antitoxin AbrB/MazE fold protein
MTASITAVFEHGLLRPTAPLQLAEGTTVELVIVSSEKGAKGGREAARIPAEIAAMPTSGGDPRTGENHDEALLVAQQPVNDIFNEMEPFTVQAGGADYSRQSLYTRMEGE